MSGDNRQERPKKERAELSGAVSYRPLAAALGCALLLLPAGCGQGLLRDHYTGKWLLQPDKVADPVRRDAYGNPILPEPPAATAPDPEEEDE